MGDDSMARMRDLMASYYGTEENSAESQATKTDLDSSSFDLEAYTQSVLLNAPLPELLQRDARLVKKVRTLDSDMQMLVYENYNKFIGATDTIRLMKSKVEEMESDMEALVEKMDAVSSSTATINVTMAPQRAKIEKLVSLSSLIKKLEFLFDLPDRLRRSVELEAYSEAVKYHNTASKFLARYTHMESFAAIQRESETIMQDLRLTLQTRLEDRDLSARGLAEIVPLLLGLGRVPDELASAFLEWHAADFRRAFAPFEGDAGAAIGVEAFVERINADCIDLLPEVTDTYHRLFVAPVEAEIASPTKHEGDADEEVGGGERSDDSLKLKKDLLEFTKQVLIDYLAVMKARFLRENVSSGEEEDGSKPLLAALSAFLGGLRSPSIEPGVRRAVRLADRGAEIAEHAVRYQVGRFFDLLRNEVEERLRTVHRRCTALAAERKACSSATGDDPAEASAMIASALAQMAEAYSQHIFDDTENCTRSLRKLVDACSSVMPEMSAIFTDLVQGQTQHFFLWLANAMELQCDPFHPARAKDGIHTSGEAIASSHQGQDSTLAASTASIRMRRVSVGMQALNSSPNFLLVLACMCRELESTVQTTSLRLVDVPELRSQMKATSGKLLKGYVELHGQHLSHMIRKSIETPDWLKLREPREVRLVAALVLQETADLVRQTKHMFGGSVVSTPGEGSAIGRVAEGERGGGGGGGSVGMGTGSEDTGYRRYSRTVGSGARRMGALQLDIERIFSERLQIFGPVLFSVESVVVGVLKICFKAFYECIRLCTLSKHGFQQVQIDTHFLRSLLPLFVDDTSVLNQLLDEVFTSAKQRCLDPTPMESAVCDSICRDARTRQRAYLAGI